MRRAETLLREPRGAQRRHGRWRESPWERDLVAPHLRQKVIGPRVYGEWPAWMSAGQVRAAREKGRKCADCLAAACLAARMKV